jgi:hypothetical protein
LKKNAELKKNEQSEKRNELINKELKMIKLSTKTLLNKKENEDRDFIIDEINKMKE